MRSRCYFCRCDTDDGIIMMVSENDYPTAQSWDIDVPVCKECCDANKGDDEQ